MQDAIRKLANELFHEHKITSEHQLKNRLKEKLEADEYCAKQLQKLYDRDISYEYLWDNKLHSQVSNIILIDFQLILLY